MRMFGVSKARGRRSVPRAKVPLTAILSMAAGDYSTTLIDVSRTGARLSGEILPPDGEQVSFRAEKVHACATVVRSGAGTCAVEFDTPIAVSEVKLLRMLGELTGAGTRPSNAYG